MLVMAKTKEGITTHTLEDENTNTYYTAQNETFEEGEFIIKTVIPKILIMKHAANNTDLHWKDIKQNKESEDIFIEPYDDNKIRNDLLNKMQCLNEYIHKFAESTDSLKKALKKDRLDSKSGVDYTKNAGVKDEMFNFGIGELVLIFIFFLKY